jgi:thiamine-monophosphate kinase
LAALAGRNRAGFESFIARHKRPPLRVAAGRFLARTHGVSAAIDLSDGLAGDLAHLLEASGVGADVHMEAIPLFPGLSSAAARLRRNPWGLAVGGGEDYELLFTASPRVKIPNKIGGIPITNVGIITPKSRGLRWLNGGGKVLKGDFPGFRHF